MRRTLVLALLLGMVLPFIGKPAHIDDANFLALAREAAENPWRPHDFIINWQGTAEPAFAVLSNPPGIGWWLAPVAHAPVEVQHLWMLPMLMLAGWGAWRLGQRIAGRGAAAALLICTSPVALLAAQALTPDIGLLALSLAGMAGILSAPQHRVARAWPWALLLGCAALFRYSAVALIVPAVLWPLMHRERRAAVIIGLAAAAPLVGLALHDLQAYGEIHLLAMTQFQAVANTPRDVFRKMVAAIAMLGGVGVLPILCWARSRRAGVGAAVGAAVGLAAGVISGHTGPAMWATVLSTTAGGAALGGAIGLRDRMDGLLLAWLGVGLAFLLTLRFTAARYWLPFLAPAVLLPLRHAGRRSLGVACILTPLIAMAIAVDDLYFARAQQRLAERASAVGTGIFAGHWGWQHHLEARGWTALDEDAPIPTGVLFAVSAHAWPQAPAPGCLTPLDRWSSPDRWPGPRVHTAAGAANLHGYLVSHRPPIETYAPWTLANDPYDTVTLWRGCTD